MKKGRQDRIAETLTLHPEGFFLAEAFRVQIRHYNQLRTNILHKDEGFERKNA